MKRAVIAFLLLTGFSSVSLADHGYSRSGINVRSGPGTHYNIVSTIGTNQSVNIEGCLADWKWCAIESQGMHGWVHAGYLHGVYNNRRVPIMTHGARLGFPVIAFEQDRYWDQYYRDRDFYRNQSGQYRSSQRRNNHWESRQGYGEYRNMPRDTYNR
jgi:uncharacterized protein YraI